MPESPSRPQGPSPEARPPGPRAVARGLVRVAAGAVAVLALLLGAAALVGSADVAAAGWRLADGAGAGDADARAVRHARFGRHAEHAVEWTLRRVDASDAQLQQVKQIVGERMQRMHALRDDHERQREALLELLSAETIDRRGVEALRQQMLASLDAATAELSTALVDVAEVLDAAQRRELVALLGEPHGDAGHHPRWHRRHRHHRHFPQPEEHGTGPADGPDAL